MMLQYHSLATVRCTFQLGVTVDCENGDGLSLPILN